jgi:hypothetical protein
VSRVSAVDLRHVEDAMRRGQRDLFVRDDQHGLAILLTYGPELREHLARGVGVEAGARLVGQDQGPFESLRDRP